MSKKSYWLGALIIMIILALALYFFLPSFGWQSEEVETPNQPANQFNASTTPEKRINDQGQEWTLDDNADLIVTGGQGQKIRFLESQIYPLKVYPGDTQKMRVVVTGDYEISGVRAEIETDNGTKIMELTKTGIVAARDLNPLLAKYQVNDQHELIILSDEEMLARRQQEINAEESGSLIKTARAAVGDKEVWEGSWTVQDTTHRDYRTKFIAYDSQGNENSLFLAWSDPCPFPNKATNGKYTQGDVPCTLSTIAGVEDGDFEMGLNSSITLENGASLVYNNNYKILLSNNGTINLSVSNPSGGLKKGYLWAWDEDGDGYSIGVNRTFSTSGTTAPSAEYKRQKNLTSTEIDCNDESNSVYPGQTQYFDTADSRGSFDYNCNGNPNEDSFMGVYGVGPYSQIPVCTYTQACKEISDTPAEVFDCQESNITEGQCGYVDYSAWQETTYCWISGNSWPTVSDFPPCGESGERAYMSEIDYQNCAGIPSTESFTRTCH